MLTYSQFLIPRRDHPAGIVTAYQNSFSYVGLSGPTYFTPIIQQAHEMAQADASSGQLKYSVLLLLTE